MKFPGWLLLGGLLSSCGLLHQSAPDPNNARVVVTPGQDPFTPTTVSLQLPGTANPFSAAAAAPAMGDNTRATASPMFDFSSAFEGAGIHGRAINWRRSGTEAALEARRAGRPLLIFFANHTSPTATLLETMLGTAVEAGETARQFVPLYIDYADKDTRDSKLYRGLGDRYRVRGYPVLLAALPDGTELMRQSGYAGETKSEPEWRKRTLQFLKAAAAQSDKAVATRRKRLESEGYRTWSSREGNPVFAKLVSLDANQAVFTTEWGESFRTFTNRLAESDRKRLERDHDSGR